MLPTKPPAAPPAPPPTPDSPPISEPQIDEALLRLGRLGDAILNGTPIRDAVMDGVFHHTDTLVNRSL